MTSTDSPLSPQLADALRRITDQGLSSASRLGHVVLLLVALGMGVAIASLLLTEPALPRRTVASFVLMLAVAAAWVAYSVWALHNRHTLMAQHRVIAGRMAAVFCGVFSAIALVAGLVAQSTAGFLAAATGMVMLLAALFLMRRARLAVQSLQRRRVQLERQIDGG